MYTFIGKFYKILRQLNSEFGVPVKNHLVADENDTNAHL